MVEHVGGHRGRTERSRRGREGGGLGFHAPKKAIPPKKVAPPKAPVAEAKPKPKAHAPEHRGQAGRGRSPASAAAIERLAAASRPKGGQGSHAKHQTIVPSREAGSRYRPESGTHGVKEFVVGGLTHLGTGIVLGIPEMVVATVANPAGAARKLNLITNPAALLAAGVPIAGGASAAVWGKVAPKLGDDLRERVEGGASKLWNPLVAATEPLRESKLFKDAAGDRREDAVHGWFAGRVEDVNNAVGMVPTTDMYSRSAVAGGNHGRCHRPRLGRGRGGLGREGPPRRRPWPRK